MTVRTKQLLVSLFLLSLSILVGILPTTQQEIRLVIQTLLLTGFTGSLFAFLLTVLWKSDRGFTINTQSKIGVGILNMIAKPEEDAVSSCRLAFATIVLTAGPILSFVCIGLAGVIFATDSPNIKSLVNSIINIAGWPAISIGLISILLHTVATLLLLHNRSAEYAGVPINAAWMVMSFGWPLVAIQKITGSEILGIIFICIPGTIAVALLFIRMCGILEYAGDHLKQKLGINDTGQDSPTSKGIAQKVYTSLCPRVPIESPEHPLQQQNLIKKILLYGTVSVLIYGPSTMDFSQNQI